MSPRSPGSESDKTLVSEEGGGECHKWGIKLAYPPYESGFAWDHSRARGELEGGKMVVLEGGGSERYESWKNRLKMVD